MHLLFVFMHKVVRQVRHNMPLSSNNDYVLHHCKAVSAQLLSSLCVSSRVAVIRGSVALQDGSPLVGVNITFPQHPEYGYTVSRQDGR